MTVGDEPGTGDKNRIAGLRSFYRTGEPVLVPGLPGSTTRVLARRAQGDVFEAKLKEKLGEGGACPHGNAVLPVSPAERRRRGEIQLSQAAEGRRYAVVSLQERDPRLLQFLHASGIGPGKTLKVLHQNYDQTVQIELATGNSILGRPAAEAVWLKLDKREQ